MCPNITQKVAKLYIDTGFGFSEKQVISQTVVSDETKLEFDLSSFSEIKALRFDPVNDYCVLHISSVVIVRKDDSSYELGYFQTNATYQKGNTLIFITNDPQILLDFPENTIQTIIINLEYIVVGEDSINYLVEYQDGMQMEQKKQIERRDTKIRECLEHFELLHGVIEEYAESVRDQMEEVQRRDTNIRYLWTQIDALQEQIKTERLSYINSSSWKITEPLRWLMMYIKKLKLNIKTAYYIILKREYKLIEKSGLFDTEYYLSKNNDVKELGVKPLVHYVAFGVREGRDPHPLFDTSYYLDENPDVVKSGINPLVHYIKVGFKEGRDPNPLFDTSYYLDENPDVTESGINPLLHYLSIGAKQGRDPHPLFDTLYYSDLNPDVAKSGMNPLTHYIEVGFKERRDPHPLFDSKYYFDLNPDVAEAGMNPLLDYISSGAREGRGPNVFFDSKYYLKKNPDVEESEMNPLIHYVNAGIREGRHPNPLIENIRYAPKISIIIRVYDVDKSFLYQCIRSILNQPYGNWELCLVDDGNKKDDIKAIIEKYARKDCRLKVIFLNGKHSAAKAFNETLSMATGEFVCFMGNNDVLSENALYEVVKVLNEKNETDIIYSDEDMITSEGIRRDPFFKPDWSPDMLRSYNYIRDLAIIRKEVAEAVGGFRDGFEGCEDYDLLLRVGETTENIAHVPKVLYHKRYFEDLEGKDFREKAQGYGNAKKALKEHMQRIGLEGDVADGQVEGTYHIKYSLNDIPKVCIIIPTKDKVEVLIKCIDSILQRTSYSNYSVMVVDNGSVENKTFEYYNSLKNNQKISFLEYDKPFNFSTVNNYAVNKADSEFLILLNNDTEVITNSWIEEMLGFGQREDVGAVGALLYYSNDTVQHAGIIIGIKGVAGHSHKYYIRDSEGYFGRLKTVQNVSAVTGACMMTKKSIFEELGGFDENMSHAFNDVDYCMKMREKGYLVIYNPYTELYHHESISRGYEITKDQEKRFEKEIRYFQMKWKDVLAQGDPYYNPNLTLDKEDFSVKDEFQYDG